MTIAKVNVDENPQTPSKYGVHGIPTLMLFKNGQVAATKIGALPKSKLLRVGELGPLAARLYAAFMPAPGGIMAP